MAESTCRLSIRVASRTLSGAEVAALFGEPPTRQVEVGDLLSPRTRRIADVAFCVWDYPVPASTHPDRALEWTTAFFERARAKLDPSVLEIDVRLSLSPRTSQTCFALSGSSLRILGALDAQLNVDVYADVEAE